MIEGLLNAVRMQAMLASQQRVTKRMGIVSSYDAGNYCAKVMLQPGDIETGWLPVASPWVGNSWGMFCPPSIGDVVDVNFQEDDIDAGYVTVRLYTDGARPLSVPSGEFWLVHKSGSFLKFYNDGSVAVQSSSHLTATVGGNLTATVTGNAMIQAATAAIRAASVTLGNSGTALKKLVNDTFVTLFNSHTHNETGAVTTIPNQTAGASHTTSVTTAE